MKLVNFRKHKPFTKLIDSMGTQLSGEFKVSKNWVPISAEELRQLSTSGIDLNIDEISKCILIDGTFEWKGQKVIVYIKEQWFNPNDRSKEYKFHVSTCTTLVHMKNIGQINRYVISTRGDGLFLISRRNPFTRKLIDIDVLEKMNICKNCLGAMIKYYPDEYDIFNYNDFKITKFLNIYNTRITSLPNFTSETLPLNEYPTNWPLISSKYRESRGWCCEKCGKDLKAQKYKLHTHHIGPKFDSNWRNLKALCIECHSLELGHQNMLKVAKSSPAH